MPYRGDLEDPGTPSEIEAVRRRHEEELVRIEGVMGLAIGRTRGGEDTIVVYLRDPSVKDRVPSLIEGHPVETLVTGVIDAYEA